MEHRLNCRAARIALAAVLVAGATAVVTASGQSPAPFTIVSSAFRHQGEIPRRYTCEGDNISPPLAWTNAPDRIKSFALIVDDPDAPDPRAPLITWVHWVLYNLPPTTHGIPENVKRSALPPGTKEGRNGWQRAGYGGPCPPVGRHRYFYKLYALDTVLPDLGTPTEAELERAMKGHVLVEAEIIGTYRKKNR